MNSYQPSVRKFHFWIQRVSKKTAANFSGWLTDLWPEIHFTMSWASKLLISTMRKTWEHKWKRYHKMCQERNPSPTMGLSLYQCHQHQKSIKCIYVNIIYTSSKAKCCIWLSVNILRMKNRLKLFISLWIKNKALWWQFLMTVYQLNNSVLKTFCHCII